MIVSQKTTALRILTCVMIIISAVTITSPTFASGVALSPFDGKLRFVPYSPHVVQRNHPLAEKISIEPVINMPDKIGLFMNSFVKSKEFDEALQSSITTAGMHVQQGDTAKFNLAVTWLSFESPFKISFSSHATVLIRYELSRVDTGAIIFRRDVSTSAAASGGNAADRQKGVARASIAANLAGGIWCLEEAAYGRAPDNCGTSAEGEFAAPFTYTVPYLRH